MSEEQTLRENVKSREVVPRDKQRSSSRNQPAEQSSKGASGGQNRRRSGKQQQRRKPRSSAGTTNVQEERREPKNQQKKRRPQKKSRNTKALQREVPTKTKGDDPVRRIPKDFDRNGLDKAQEIKQVRGEAQSIERNRRTEKSDAQDKSPRGGDRLRRDRKKRMKNDLAFRAEETVEDIKRDITRIEKDIQIDIDSIRNQKLDL
jgi:hypothetical protein